MKKISLQKILSYLIPSLIVPGVLLAASLVNWPRPSPPGGFNFNRAAQGGLWTRQTSGVTDTLWSVHFINNTVGWAAGENAALLRTTNGGANWAPASHCISPPEGFFSVRLLNQSLIWAGGDLSVARTGDGGTSFDCGLLDLNAFHNSYFPTSTNVAWSAGFYVDPNPPNLNCRFLSRLTFSGSSFTEELFTECPGGSLYDIYFVNSGNGWAVGEAGQIVRIANATATPPTITAQTSGTTQLLWGIYMLDLNLGWAVGDGGTILKTTNGGSSWSPLNSGTTADLRDVHFVSANNGWVVGAGGIILTTADGGANWTPESSGVTEVLNSVFFPSANVGYAAGENGAILKRAVGCGIITVNPPAIPNGTAGATYPPTTFTAVGGSSPYTFSLTGALPAGMMFVGGALSGVPTQTGGFPVTVSATDLAGCIGNRNYTLTINCPTITVNPPSIPAGTVGAAYNQTFTHTGGVGSVNFSLNSGALPGGLALSSGGTLSGTPTQCGAFNFVVKATDANNCMGTRGYTLLINGPTITLNPPTLPGGTVGEPYNQTVAATGGAAPYTFSVTSGSLPPGLTLSAGGTLAGTLTTHGVFNFTITATDANGCAGARPYTVTIAPVIQAALQFYPLPRPVRLLETRPGQTGCFNNGSQPLATGGAITQPARVTCDGITIPANAQAVVGNATVVNSPALSTGFQFITLWPSNAQQPTVSNLNFTQNQIIPNSFTVGLGGDGAFKIFSSGATHFIVDITGYYAPPGTGGLYFHPLPRPVRLLETRPGQIGCFKNNDQPLASGGTITQPARVTCDGLTIPSNAQAVVGNATVVNFISPGFNFITLWPSSAPQPTVSNLNYTLNQIIPNSFIAGLGNDGAFKLFSSGGTHFIVDVTGYFSPDAVDANGPGLLFNPLPRPIRLLETRPGETGCFGNGGQPLAAGQTFTLTAQGTCGGITIPASAQTVVGNGTVVNFNSMGFSFITLWPTGASQPTVSNLNFMANQIIPNSFTVRLGTGGAFNIFASGATHFIVDLSGYFAP